MEQRPDWTALVESARAGDRDAQCALLARFEPLAIATARRLAPPGLVDDVVQHSYLVALETLPQLRTLEAFPSWLRLIVRKQASRLRAQPSEPLDVSSEPTAPGVDPAEAAARSEVVNLVRMALAAARDQDRELLELRYLAGWSNEELARQLGLSPGAVRKRLHDARRRLRPHLEHLNPKEPTMTDFSDLLGAVHDATIDVPTTPRLNPPSDTPTVTGLKVIDTMAPIRRGGTIEMIGPAGTGHVVVTLELLYRIGRTEHPVACVGVGRADTAIGSQPDLGHIVTEPGIPGPNTVILTSGPDETIRGFDAGARIAAGLAHDGLDVILAVDRPTLVDLDPAKLTRCVGLAAEGSVTLVALNTLDSDDPIEPIGLDATLVFSLEHLARRIFPAIDGTRSTSVLDITDTAWTARQRLADAASLQAWFNQPMYVAKDYTGDDGTWIEPAEAQAELAQLSR